MKLSRAVYGIKEKQLSASRSLTPRAGALTALVTEDLSEELSICKQLVKLEADKSTCTKYLQQHRKECTLNE